VGDREAPEDPKETEKWESEKKADKEDTKQYQADEDEVETKIWEGEKEEGVQTDEE
jgi:hypothetical protein